MRFDIVNAVLTAGTDDVIDATVIGGNDCAADRCIAMYAGVNGGTICKPLGSTAFTGGANVPTTGAISGRKVDEFGGSIRNIGGGAMLDEARVKL